MNLLRLFGFQEDSFPNQEPEIGCYYGFSVPSGTISILRITDAFSGFMVSEVWHFRITPCSALRKPVLKRSFHLQKAPLPAKGILSPGHEKIDKPTEEECALFIARRDFPEFGL